MPSYISSLLAEVVVPQVTARLQAELRKFVVGAVIRNYLPQTWWFISDTGSATFYVDRDGIAAVYDGQSGNPDVSITWTDRAYCAAVGLQDRSQIPHADGQPSVVPHTQRGATAFGQVRKQLGL